MSKKKQTLMIETVMADLVQEYQEEPSLSQAISLPDEAADDPLVDVSLETCVPLSNQEQDLEQKKTNNTEVLDLMEFKPNESGLTSKKEEKSKKKSKKKQNVSKSTSEPPKAEQKLKKLSSDTASIIELPVKKRETAGRLSSPSFTVDGNAALAAHSHQKQIPLFLQQAENLGLAQERITSLEEEIQRLRQENEELITTSDIFKERLDKILAKNDDLKKAHQENREDFITEKKTLMDTLSEQSREIDKLQVKNKELEKRLSNNLQHIRVRERELENRLELIKVDSQTLVREKNRYILQLKRQMERAKMDLNTHKSKYSELKHSYEEQLEQSRKAVRGIQMIMHILKGHSVSQDETEQPIEPIQEPMQEQEQELESAPEQIESTEQEQESEQEQEE